MSTHFCNNHKQPFPPSQSQANQVLKQKKSSSSTDTGMSGTEYIELNFRTSQDFFHLQDL